LVQETVQRKSGGGCAIVQRILYLFEFEVHFYDARTEKLMASGKSRRPSLNRQGPEHMVNEVLVEIFDTPPDEAEPE